MKTPKPTKDDWATAREWCYHRYGHTNDDRALESYAYALAYARKVRVAKGRSK